MSYHKIDRLVEYLYDELPETEGFEVEEHIGNCNECRLEFVEAKQLLNLADRRIRLEPSMTLLAEYRQDLQFIGRGQQIGHRESVSWVGSVRDAMAILARRKSLRYAGAVAVLFAMLTVGSLKLSYHKVELQNYYADLLAERIYPDDVNMRDYFNKVEMVLLAVDNFDVRDGGESFDFDYYRAMADELQHQTRYLIEFYDREDNHRSVLLLAQLELIFLQLANVEEGQVEEELVVLQRTLDEVGLLLELRGHEELGSLL